MAGIDILYDSIYACVLEDTGEELFSEQVTNLPAVDSIIEITKIDSVTTTYKVERVVYKATEFWESIGQDALGAPLPNVPKMRMRVEVVVSIIV